MKTKKLKINCCKNVSPNFIIKIYFWKKYRQHDFEFFLVLNFFKKYRKWAYEGHIGHMVRNDFDHQKKYQDLFFIKGNLG